VCPRYSATHFDSCARQLYVLAVRVRRAPFCGDIHDNAAPRESECSRTDPLSFQVSMARTQARSVSSQLRSSRNATSTVLLLVPLFSRFHSHAPRVQTIQRPAARRSSASRERPYGVSVPPTSRAPSKNADLGTWELSYTRALRVVCLERLRASKENFRCTTTP
jgi:hypothetical protein